MLPPLPPFSLTHTHTPIVTFGQGLQGRPASMIFFFFGLLMNMQDASYLSSSLLSPPFLNSSWPPLPFS